MIPSSYVSCDGELREHGGPISTWPARGEEGSKAGFLGEEPCHSGLRVSVDLEGLAWVTPTQSRSERADRPGPAQ